MTRARRDVEGYLSPGGRTPDYARSQALNKEAMMAKKRKRSIHSRADEDDEEGEWEDDEAAEGTLPPDPPGQEPDERPPNPLPAMPRITITWLGPSGESEATSKFWHQIEFPAGVAVPIDHLPTLTQQAMVRDCEGSTAWKVEVIPGEGEPVPK